MKKRGAALAIVLIVGSVLLILCTAISSAVINTTKLNKRYSENIDLELAAKSGLNLVKEDFITRVNKKEIKTLDNIKEYIEKINSISDEFSANIKSTDFQEIKNFFNEYLNEDIILDINLQIKDSNKLEIQSVAEDKSHKNTNKEETQILVFNFNDSTVDDGNNPGGGETGGNDSESSAGKLVFDKLFNIGNNIDKFGMNNTQGQVDYFQYGGNLNNFQSSNSGSIPPTYNPELSKIEILFNDNEVWEKILKYKGSESLSNLENKLNIFNKVLKDDKANWNNTNFELTDSKVLFVDGGTNYGRNTIKLLSNSGEGSELIFGGDVEFETGLTIEKSENSTFIVNGNLTVGNEFKIQEANNSVFVINGDLIMKDNKLDINLKNSIFIVKGNIWRDKWQKEINGLNVTLENSAFICLGDMNLNNPVTIVSNGKSFIYSGNFKCENAQMQITINPPGGYVPDSPVVNNAINSFLNVNKN